MFFSSVKEINMLNVKYSLTSYYLEKLTLSKLQLQSFSQGQFLGSLNSRRYHWILKLLVANLKSEIWE